MSKKNELVALGTVIIVALAALYLTKTTLHYADKDSSYFIDEKVVVAWHRGLVTWEFFIEANKFADDFMGYRLVKYGENWVDAGYRTSKDLTEYYLRRIS